MAFQNSDRLRTLTHHFLDEDTKPPQVQHPISPIFHNFPWLPTPPMSETLPQMEMEPVELPGTIPAFELPGSSTLIKSDKVIYAEVWLTESPPPYSFYPPPPSPTLSAKSCCSDESNSTMHSAKSHLSQSSTDSLARVNPSRAPRSLKRKQAPQDITLRQLRKKESETELRKMYEQQTDAYLEELFATLGSPIPRPLSVIQE